MDHRRLFGIAFHSLVLAAMNLISILAGFGLYLLIRPANQLSIQAPAAFVVSVAGFSAWMAITHRMRHFTLRVRALGDGLWLYLLGFPCAVTLFVPLHLATQGHLTSFGNLVAIGLFQSVVNIVAVFAGLAAIRGKLAEQ
jgi:hypothetical protein